MQEIEGTVTLADDVKEKLAHLDEDALQLLGSIVAGSKKGFKVHITHIDVDDFKEASEIMNGK